MDFLKQRGGQIHSRLLMLLAEKASVDPFAKVKKMIQEMIVKLMESGNEEAEHKAFCDLELQTNQQTREGKGRAVESIKADMEELTANILKLGDQITATSEEIVQIDVSVATATSDRDAEKAKNAATVTDATVAGQATAQALALLKEFYNKAAEPVAQLAPNQGPIKYDTRALANLQNFNGGASFFQTSSTTQSRGDKPEMEEGGYQGQGNGGVLGLLEVIESDFTKIAAETQNSEQESARDYEKFMSDSSEDKAVKGQEMKHLSNSKSSKEVDLGDQKKNLRITNEELDAALAYYDKLKPSCETSGPSYEEKVAQRKKEIESLQEALQILAGDGIALQLLEW